MEYLFLLGRVLFGGYFVMNGMNHLLQGKAMIGYAEMKGVPAPRLAVYGSGLMILLGGLGILSGIYVPHAIALIALFLVPVTFKMHAFWNVTDPNMRMAEMINFNKNLALLGAVLMMLFIPQPWMWSLVL